MSKKILIVSCVFPPEPVVSAQISFDLASALSKDNMVVVIAPKPSRPLGYKFEEVVEEKTQFYKVQTNSYVNPKSKIISRFHESYSFGNSVAKYISKHSDSIDIVYLNSWPLLSQYLIVKACKKKSIPSITHVQDIYPETLINKLPILKSFFYKLLLPIDKYILANSAKVVTISHGMKDKLSKTRNINSGKIDVIYNWQKINIQSPSKDKNDKFTFIYLGSLSPSAQIESVIEAIGELANPKMKLVIAGSGSEEENLKRIASKYSTADIVFVKAISEEVPKIQSKADVLLLPLREGVGKIALPSKLVSYMYSSKPVLAIVDEDSDIEKIIKEAECGWVLRQNDKEKLKNKILEVSMLSNEELVEKGENAFAYATNNLARKKNLSLLANLVLNVKKEKQKTQVL